MKPYLQGEIDYFCGIYAVINACCYMAGKNKRPFSFVQSALFYQELIQYLLDNRLFEEILKQGTSYAILPKILQKAADILLFEKNIHLNFQALFKNTLLSERQAFEKIGSYLQTPGTACIFRLQNKTIGDHWTVMTTLSTKKSKIKMFDSYGLTSLSLKEIRWAPEKKNAVRPTLSNPTGAIFPKKGITFIPKQGIFLLETFPQEN